MKGKQYFSFAVCAVGLIAGAAVLLLVAIFTEDFSVALLCGLGTSLIVGLLIPFFEWNADRRYRDIEDDIPEEVLLKEQISFSFPQSGRGGYLCVTEEAMYFFSRDRKPHFSFRLPREAMLAAEITSERALRFSVLDLGTGRVTAIALFTSKGREILSVLDKSGWF